MEISVGPANLASLLNDPKTISVPNFQRNYSWGASEIDPFLQDLFAAIEDDQRHFFGPIVLLTSATERLLVDGQQRITTAIMSLAIVRDYIYGLPQGETLYNADGYEFDLKSYRMALFDPANPTKAKFESNYQLKDLFRNGVLEDPNSSKRLTFTKMGTGLSADQVRLTKELRASYLRLKAIIYRWLDTGQTEEIDLEPASFSDRRKRIMQLQAVLTSGFEIHSMVLAKEEDAFVLFETLNERGLKLSPADLLKTLIMREVLRGHGEHKLEAVLKDWDSTNDNVGDYPFSKFLRHHLLTLETSPVQMRKVFGLFKARVVGKSKDTPLAELENLKKSSANYKLLLETLPYSRINAFSETHRVFLLSLLNSVHDEKTRKLLTRAVEYLAFRWIACGLNAQTLESKYQELGHLVSGLKDKTDASGIVKKIIAFAPNDIAFRSALDSLESEPLQKFLLRRVEEALGGHHAWDDALTLEHLAPQTPADNCKDWVKYVPVIELEDGTIDYAKRIAALGNMSLLEKGLNSAIQNFCWSTKVGGTSDEDGYKGLTASSALINKSLVEISQWSGDLILRRNSYLVECALSLFSEKWVNSGSTKIAPFKE